MPRYRIIYPLFLVTVLLCGCATRSAMLPAREQVGESATPVMIALESYRSDAKFFIKYRFGEQILYAGGDWQDRLELSTAPVSADYAAPSMVPMQFHQQERWDALPNDATSIPILGVEQWQLLRDGMLRAVVPANGKGLVVDFEFISKLEPPTTLREVKESGKFSDWALVRQSRLSTMGAPKEFVEWMKTRHRRKGI